MRKKLHEKRAIGYFIISLIIFIIILIPIILNAIEPEPLNTTATYSKGSITNGERITILSTTGRALTWSDIKIRLSDGNHNAEWFPKTTDLNVGYAIRFNYSTDTLGILTICCEVFDAGGNGYVGGGDYIQFFTYDGALTFSQGKSYTFSLIYRPSGEQIGPKLSFTG